MCVVILRPSAMKYVVFSDSYVSRLGRLDLSLCLPGEVRFFGRGCMRVLHVPNDEWRQMMIFSPDHVILHLDGNDLTMESVPRTGGDKILSLVVQTTPTRTYCEAVGPCPTVSALSECLTCVVILRPSAMKYVVFGDSYVSRLDRLDLSLCLPGEVRFFGRGGMRFLHVPNDEWRQMMIFFTRPCYFTFGWERLDYGVRSQDCGGQDIAFGCGVEVFWRTECAGM